MLLFCILKYYTKRLLYNRKKNIGISVMLMQISPRLLSAWSDFQCLKNVHILKKVKRSTMQTEAPQNNT